jgi:hypothetical protein
MNYIERNYIEKVGVYLNNFIQKDDELWNCSCPYCGDSKRNSRKARGFFLVGTEGNAIYSCRNCTNTVPLGIFLQDNFPNYYTQYKLDMFSKKETKLSIKVAPRKSVQKLIEMKEKLTKSNEVYTAFDDLGSSHPARTYIEGRGIPNTSDLGYVNNFKRYVAEMTNNDSRYEKLPSDNRIIIPLKLPNGELMGFQGRAIDKTDLRYITIKIPDMEEQYVKIYGLDKYNKDKAGFGVEGPLDSKFLPNCFGMCGTSLDMQSVKRELIIPKNTIIVIDNEPRNRQVVNRMYQYVEDGFRIYIPPNHLNTLQNDINKMILSGWTTQQLTRLFVTNSHTGIKAKLKINIWKKV